MVAGQGLRAIFDEAGRVRYGKLPIPTEIDNKIIVWLKSNYSLIAGTQDFWSSGLSQADLFLSGFAERMATFVLRTGSQEHYNYGLRALALAHSCTYDERDVLLVLCLYIDLSLRFNLSTNDALRADDPFIRTFTDFSNREPEDKAISVMGYVIQHEESGPRYKRTW